MSNEKDFDFKIRDELKKRFEYKILRSDLTDMKIHTETGDPVTGEMLIDMVAYCSQGDMDIAIRGLQASRQLISRCCFPFLRSYNRYLRLARANRLLFEIWRLGFIKTKYLLDWNEHVSEQQLPTHRLLEQQIATMNEMNNQVNVSSSEKLFWIDNRIDQFEEYSSVVEELWRNKKELAEAEAKN